MTMASRHFITSGATPLLIRTLMESQMTSAAKHLPPEYSVSTSLCLLQLGGLEKIALCTAGDIITFIACGRAHLFPSPREREERERLLPHTPTFSASLWADGLETVFLFFIHHCLFFWWRCYIQSCAVWTSLSRRQRNQKIRG